jgi:CubicO group peptidase (beta-lactamase class C family)
MRLPRYLLPLVIVFAAAGAQAAPGGGIPRAAKPETVGFSTERLEKLHAGFEQLVASKQLPGYVTVVARHGKIVAFNAGGMQDIAGNVPMKTDTIFYMASQTKVLNAVGMMMLYEEGKWRAEDPISKFLPEFANLKVQTGVDKDGKFALEDPKHAPTMGELMTMTAGFSYANYPDANPIDRMYRDTHVLQSPNLGELVNRISKIPLLYQPGTHWAYSASADIQGAIIEKLSGQKIADFYRQRLFLPLGMKDSSFQVPPEKLSRLAKIYHVDRDAGTFTAQPMTSPEGTPPNVVSGAGGLYTTAEDYLRFGLMLVNNGELNGARILSPSSVKLMRTNHLADSLIAAGQADGCLGRPCHVKPGYGYGYDVAVAYDPIAWGSTLGAGSYHWGGAFGTWFWVDPTNDLVFVGMIQVMGQRKDVRELSQTWTYQALVDPEI